MQEDCGRRLPVSQGFLNTHLLSFPPVNPRVPIFKSHELVSKKKKELPNKPRNARDFVLSERRFDIRYRALCKGPNSQAANGCV